MKLKLRFLINSLAGGGAEKVLVDLLNQLDPDAYDITLVSVLGGVHKAKLPEYINHRQIITCNNSMLKKVFSTLIYKMPAKLFSAMFLRGNYDIEVSYLEGRPTRFLAAKETDSPKLAFVHCDLSVNNIIAPIYRNNEECLQEYQSFSKVCFVSEQAKQGFEKVIGSLDNACVIHNVIDRTQIKKMSEKPCETEYKTNGWKLVTVGRLAPEKAFDRLLRIVSELEKTHDLELWIIGEGSERENLEKIIEENQIKSVKLLGYKENPYPYVKQADLFICSSLFEGYSTAVTEAIALGVPVITTDCAGMNEILENGKYGYICENSESSLKNMLANVFSDKEKISALKHTIYENVVKTSNMKAVDEYTELFSIVT